jgi:hypothetical protein
MIEWYIFQLLLLESNHIRLILVDIFESHTILLPFMLYLLSLEVFSVEGFLLHYSHWVNVSQLVAVVVALDWLCMISWDYTLNWLRMMIGLMLVILVYNILHHYSFRRTIILTNYELALSSKIIRHLLVLLNGGFFATTLIIIAPVYAFHFIILL